MKVNQTPKFYWHPVLDEVKLRDKMEREKEVSKSMDIKLWYEKKKKYSALVKETVKVRVSPKKKKEMKVMLDMVKGP